MPAPYLLKENILTMEFIGEKNIAAKRLRDVKLDLETHSDLYL